MQTSEHHPAAVQLIDGLSAIIGSRELLLCDVWGVVHNGVEAFPEAGEALARFREGGGTVVLISNAPRPADGVAWQLDHLGVPSDAYDAIVTSGDLTREEVVARSGEPVRLIGPDRDRPIFDGLPVSFADVNSAGYIVCTGLFDDETETAETYRGELEVAARRGLVLVCANPDIVVERGDKLIPCAGAVAGLYAALGGQVVYAGKPYPAIYEAAIARAARLRGAPVPNDRILAIGDSIHTDVAGACGMDIPIVLVARGIHARELALPREGDFEHIQRWARSQPHKPTAVIETLRW